ncbi:MAG TPA: MJ0042-type zinc finger domain-containing protein, partial [Paraburkholderia sp.]|nr:MJ0042-type zinc finger domain-containing protein [Paraburkholderia sp.]
MLLATRCPFCETVFRLQPAQLALRRGLVRCGHCNEVFDASSSLFDITEG